MINLYSQLNKGDMSSFKPQADVSNVKLTEQSIPQTKKNLSQGQINATDDIAVSKLEKGVVSKPITFANNKAVILKVIDRTSVSEEEKKQIEPMVRFNLQSEIAPRIWANWLEENLASMDFQTTMSLEDTAEAAE